MLYTLVNEHTHRDTQRELIFVGQQGLIKSREGKAPSKKWNSILENYRDLFLRGTVGSVLGAWTWGSAFKAWLCHLLADYGRFQKAAKILLLPFTMRLHSFSNREVESISLPIAIWLCHVTCFVTRRSFTNTWTLQLVFSLSPGNTESTMCTAW